MSQKNILEVKNLNTVFYTEKGTVEAVKNLSFELEPEQTLGIVGESGSGKSVSNLSIMGLLPSNISETSGEVLFNNQNLLSLSNDSMREIRGKEISMIFQEPMTSLNPVFTIENQLSEVFLLRGFSKAEAKDRSIEILKKVSIPFPERRIKNYPHELSGGMKQRVMIAMALSFSPKVLICDEPTTALDVTTQAQILDLMLEIKEQEKLSIIFVSHDLGVIYQMADKVMVMYAGQMVEQAEKETLFSNPEHPYTQALLKSLPKLGQAKDQVLYSIPGQVPSPINLPDNCSFHNRCEKAMAICKEKRPSVYSINEDHQSRCYLSEKK